MGATRRRSAWTPLPSGVVSDSVGGSTTFSSTGRDGRQAGDEPGATAKAAALGPHPPAVGLDDPPADGQPKPAAAVAAGAGRIHPEEPLEHPVQQLRSDPLTGIAHRQLNLVAALR